MSGTDRIAGRMAVVLVALALAPHAQAQQIKREPVRPMAGVSGSATFREYCTVCHGIGGKGDGPAAKALKVPPADLTLMASRRGGPFVHADALAIIKGDTELAAHGTREMPMWGVLFHSVDPQGVAELRMSNLVKYLASIQREPAAR